MTHARDSADDLPLAGVRVVEFAQMVAGPAAGLQLADYGAEVIKVEPPHGDGARQLKSIAASDLPVSPVFSAYNRNKTLLQLDLRSDVDLAHAWELIESADVVITSSRPGVMDRLGLGPEAVRDRVPEAIYAEVSGFGDGPLGASRGGVDIVVQAESGLMSTTGPGGGPPTKVGFTVVDAATGHVVCHAILAALLQRYHTGRGRHIHVSLYDVALHLQTGPLAEYLATGIQTPRSGNSAPLTAPAGVFQCREGHIVISAYLPRHWQALCEVIGATELLDDPRYTDAVARAHHRQELTTEIERRLATATVDEWLDRLRAVGVLAAAVREYADVVTDPMASETGMLVTTPGVTGVASPVRLGLSRGAAPRPARAWADDHEDADDQGRERPAP